jgi:hypothetical protein
MPVPGISSRCTGWDIAFCLRRAASLVSRGNDAGVFHHEHDRAFKRARAVHYSARHNVTLPGRYFDSPAFEIDQQFSVDYVKEFIVGVVLVPVVFALNNGHANYRIIHLAERLVVPLVRARIGQGLLVDQLHRLVENVQARLIRISLGAAHSFYDGMTPASTVARRIVQTEIGDNEL